MSKKNVDNQVDKFTKEQILMSDSYKDKRDILTELLDKKKEYSFVDVDNILDDFMKGRVN